MSQSVQMAMVGVGRCRQLIDLFPNMKLAKVVCQPWEGDITMLLPSTWRDLTKSILDPSKDELKEACRQVHSPLPLQLRRAASGACTLRHMLMHHGVTHCYWERLG